MCPVLVSQPFPCSPAPNEFGRLLKWKEGNNVLQHSIGFNSGKYDQIIPAVLLVFHFPVCGRQEGAQRWPLSLWLCKHGMALITDAYLGVTSEAGHLLFVSALCSPPRRPVFERHPASGKAHAKGCSSSLKRLSSQGAAALWLLSGGGSLVLSATRGTQGCPSEESLWSLLLRGWNLKAVTIYVFCFVFFDGALPPLVWRSAVPSV